MALSDRYAFLRMSRSGPLYLVIMMLALSIGGGLCAGIAEGFKGIAAVLLIFIIIANVAYGTIWGFLRKQWYQMAIAVAIPVLFAALLAALFAASVVVSAVVGAIAGLFACLWIFALLGARA